MSSRTCASCGRWVFGAEHHRCPPEWEARVAEFHGDDWTTVRGALDAEDAAEKLAESCDGENNLIDDHDGWLVEVRKPGANEVQRFRVFAEVDVNYNAQEEP